MKRIVPIFLIIILLLSGCSSQKHEEVEKEAQVEMKIIKPIYIMAGRIEANEKVGITSKIKAKVSEIQEKIFQGEISVIDPVIDLKSKTILVKVSIKDKDVALKQMMHGLQGIL